MECSKKQKQIFIVALDETGKAYPKEIYIDSSISPYQVEEYLEDNCIEYFTWDYNRDYIADIAEIANSDRNRDDGPLDSKFLKCKQCGKYYILTSSTIEWYKENELSIPKRCKACRKNNKKKN